MTDHLPHDPRMDRFLPADSDDAKTFVEVARGLISDIDLDLFHLNHDSRDPVDLIALVLTHGEKFHALLELARLGGGTTPVQTPSEEPSEHATGPIGAVGAPNQPTACSGLSKGSLARVKEA